LQARYCRELLAWSHESGLPVFVFEAFDEPWKGSSDPLEPEKHWGLFTVERRPKPVIADLFPVLAG
jgi:exo-beta-1,3-glucanase (GH17 family)